MKRYLSRAECGDIPCPAESVEPLALLGKRYVTPSPIAGVDEYTGSRESTSGDRLRVVVVSLGLTFLGYVVGVVFASLGFAVVQGLGVPVGERPLVQTAITIVALQGIAFGGVSLAYLAGNAEFDLVGIGVPSLRELGVGLVGLVGLFVGAAALIAVFTSVGVEFPTPTVVERGRQNPEIALLLVPLAYLLIAPGEELLFRGVIQGALRRAYSPVAGVVIATAIFAIPHFFNVAQSGLTAGSGAYLFVIFALGLILGGLYEYTGNLAVPIVVHGTWNAFQFLNLYFQSTGGWG